MTRGNRERALATLERIARENGKAMPKGKLMEPSLKVCFFLHLFTEKVLSPLQRMERIDAELISRPIKCMWPDQG